MEGKTLEEDSPSYGKREKEFTFTSFIIISHKGWFSQIWRAIDIILCMISSYVYIWFAVFGLDESTWFHFWF